jgi:hypothetical protein
MLRLAPVIVAMILGLVTIFSLAVTLWQAQRSGVLTGGDLPKGVRIERSTDPVRFNQYMRDRVRSMALPIGFAVSAILLGALALSIALVSGGG